MSQSPATEFAHSRCGLAGTTLATTLALAIVHHAAPAFAQPRPDEQELFGAAVAEPSAANGTPVATSSTLASALAGQTMAGVAGTSSAGSTTPYGASAADVLGGSLRGEGAVPQSANEPQPKDAARDVQILGTGEAPPMFTEDAAPADPLTIGGQAYLRAQSTAAQGQGIGDFAFSSPSMLDVYMDARPNDRVRAFARGRMLYDPTLAATATTANTIATASATGGTAGTQSLASLFQAQTRDPKVYLDQLWLNFDIYRRVFVTAGKQHVRWGTGHFWAPTDYLHLRPRNPLDVFDARTGTSMVKVHLPIESRQWNFYAYGVTEGPGASSTLGSLAAAARAEFVLGTTELGLGVFGRRGSQPKLAADLSTGIGDFDFYVELGMRSQSDVDRLHYQPGATIPEQAAAPSWQNPSDVWRNQLEQVVDARYPVYRRTGLRPQTVGGVSYARKYNDNDTFTIGAEYFYNSFGYPSPIAYPGLVLPHSRDLSEPANFFYLGQHYGAVYATFPAPYSLDNHTFSLSTLGNLSDQSFITRFDYTFVLLTHVRLEAFVSAHYGNPNGEFRFGVRELNLGGFNFTRPPAIGDCGIALRMAI